VGQVSGHVFISYVREDAHQVDRLQGTLEAAGIRVWRDTADLWPGEDWRAKIRSAITSNALVFLACFSETSLARRRSYQNEEFVLAIEQLRLRPPEHPWLIPVRFDDCEIPDRDIGGGRMLTSIQRVDLFGDRYDEAARRLVLAILRILGREPDSAWSGTAASVSKNGLFGSAVVMVDGDHLMASLREVRNREASPRRRRSWNDLLHDIFDHLATFGVVTVYVTRSDTNEQRDLLHAARQVGATVNLLDRRGPKGSNIDIVMATAVMADLGSISKLLLVTGDSDFVPLVKQAERAHIEVTVACVGSAASRELIGAAHAFLDLLDTVAANNAPS
jgi:hypothetical protein